MTREEFIKLLKDKEYPYELEWNKIVVTHKDRNSSIYLPSLVTLPPGVVFENDRDVVLKSLETIPPGVEFRNKWDVNLDSLETLSPDVQFKNGGYVSLNSLETLPPGVKFKNDGEVYLKSLKTLPPGVIFENGLSVRSDSLFKGWFDRWSGNIEGIDSKRLLNKMIELGLFNRR